MEKGGGPPAERLHLLSGTEEEDTSSGTAASSEQSGSSSSAAAPSGSESSQQASTGSSTAPASSRELQADDPEPPGDLLSHLSQFLYEKLGLGNNEEPVHVLDEPSIDGIVRYIHGGKCKNIIAMIGAGISTAAGIPDFRSPSSGIYSKLGKFNLPSPEAIFEIGYFRRNPAPFYALARQLFPEELKPTLSHYFLRLLHEKGLLLRLYTQNIDALERLAGIPEQSLVEAHGTFHSSHCIACNHAYTLDWLRERIASEPVPLCEECKFPVKPDIVFFGERLPDRFFDLSEEDFAQCDLLLIIGTSLQVQPFAGLVDKVHNSIPRLLINLEKCGQGNLVSKLLGFGCGLDFDSEANYRDVALLGTCDSGCQEMADRLGWKEDLAQLVKQAEEQRLAEAAAKVEAEREAKQEAKQEAKREAKQEASKAAPKAADGHRRKNHEGAEKGKKRRSPHRSPRSRSQSPTKEGGSGRVRLVPALIGLFQRWRQH